MITVLKKVFTPYREIVRYNEPLSKHTSFHIGGNASVFITPKTLSQIQSVYKLCCSQNIPVLILGKGSNLLVNDRGVNGVVLKSEWLNIKREGQRIIVSAAYPLPRLVNDTIKMGLSGLEPLVGIPGSVGGAVIMNAGGKYGQIADVIESVRVINKKGRIKTLDVRKNELHFDYRYSNLRNKLVSEVVIRLKSPSRQMRKRVREILAEKKRTQPLNARSAGCIFKNQPCFSAGALIDKAGLKGITSGGAKISDKHANFIVNTGNATASDVKKLIAIIKKTVYKKFGISLGLEIELW